MKDIVLISIVLIYLGLNLPNLIYDINDSKIKRFRKKTIYTLQISNIITTLLVIFFLSQSREKFLLDTPLYILFFITSALICLVCTLLAKGKLIKK